MDTLLDLKTHIEQDIAIWVVDYWKNTSSSPFWQEWKTINEDLGTPVDVDLGPSQDETMLMRIWFKHGPDILRWGYSSRGFFSIWEVDGCYEENLSMVRGKPQQMEWQAEINSNPKYAI